MRRSALLTPPILRDFPPARRIPLTSADSRSAVICGKVVIAGERSSYVNRKLLCGKRSPGSGNSRGGIGTRLYSELLARSTGAAVVQRQLLLRRLAGCIAFGRQSQGSSGYQGLTPAEFSHLPLCRGQGSFGIELFSQDTLVRSPVCS